MTHYEQLGIEQTADAATVEAAWQLCASTWHPDKFAKRPARDQQLAATKFRAAREARDVLGDATRRAAYDRTLTPAPAAAPASTPGQKGAFERLMGREPTEREAKGMALFKATMRVVRG